MIILYLFLLTFAIVVLRIITFMPKAMLKDIAQFKLITSDDIAFAVLFYLSIGTIIWMLISIFNYIF